MLTPLDLQRYRELRELSYREVSNYCEVSHTMISEVEKGNKGLTQETHDEIVKGINGAYQAKINGTLKAENTKKPKEDTTPEATPKVETSEGSTTKKNPPKKATTRTKTTK